MEKKDVIFQRLLERGFYPQELPPTFTTTNYGSLLAANPNYLKPQQDFSGDTIFLDGATYQGNHRTFGVINPINYALLSHFISENWDEIAKVLKIGKFSAFKVKFPDDLNTAGRSFKRSDFSEKLRKKAVLASSYPFVLHLDINRFYGSIYTHSIPWAALGKPEALKRFNQNTLKDHWSEQLDCLVRACNRRQTIGLPIGPDTSRVVSELILSRIDRELREADRTLRKRQVFHSIDDYEIGVLSATEAERVAARFEREIRKFELRSHDGKTKLVGGQPPENLRWETKFSLLRELEGDEFLDGLFALIDSERKANLDSNVVGYALRRYAREIAGCSDHQRALRHLQTLLYSSAHYVSWVAPLMVGLKGDNALDSAQKRLLRWGVEESSRRHDTVSLLWYLFLHIEFGLKLSKKIQTMCLEVESVLVDLVVVHANSCGLATGDLKQIQDRYSNSTLDSPAWLFLYEVEKRGWIGGPNFQSIGTASDPRKFFKLMRDGDVSFYDPEASGVSAFGWGLKDDHFGDSRLSKMQWAEVEELRLSAKHDFGSMY